MPGEGRGLSWKQTQEVTKTEGLAMSLTTPESVQKLQTALHDKAKRSPDFRFYALYDKVYRRDVLSFAYKCCKANGGAAGVDNQTFEDIEAYGVERWLDELTQALKSRTYRPLPVRRVRQRTPSKRASPVASGTPRFTTSITTAASSAAIAWKPAPPTPSRTGTALKRPAIT